MTAGFCLIFWLNLIFIIVLGTHVRTATPLENEVTYGASHDPWGRTIRKVMGEVFIKIISCKGKKCAQKFKHHPGKGGRGKWALSYKSAGGNKISFHGRASHLFSPLRKLRSRGINSYGTGYSCNPER